MRKGFISLLALVCLFLAESAALVTASLAAGSVKIAKMSADGIQAQYLAESGLSIAAAKLSGDATFAAATCRTTFVKQPDIEQYEDEMHSFCVYIKGDASQKEIVAVGRSYTMRREVCATLTKAETGSFTIEKITR